MEFTYLVDVSEKVRSTRKKKEKIAIIADLLRRARGREISLAANYLSGTVPLGKLGIGWRTIQDALQDLPAQATALNVIDIQTYLSDLAKTTGAGSTQKKKHLLRELFSKNGEKEIRFLVGLIMGEIRQGALEGLVLEAVAKASSLSVERIRKAFMFSGNIGEIAEAAIEAGAVGLDRFGPKLFQPISPMLAHPADKVQAALERLGEAAWEFKIDGARIQIHKRRDTVRIYSRHLKDVTERLPEIVSLAREFRAEEAIIEGEAIALRKNGKPFPFQTTMRRFGRILNVEQMLKEIPLTPYFFDLLFLDGDALFNHRYRERILRLNAHISSEYVIPHTITSHEAEVQDFLKRSLRSGHEGLMAKGLESPYVAGQRGFHWLKIKPVKTLDLVILAAEWGHGRRKGWLSNIHLGSRDPESGQYVMLGKTFKGLTDKMLAWMTEKLLSLETSRDRYTVYVRPELVAEIAYNDLQKSSRYPGGLALRFARVKRFREDKSAAEADTIQTVWSIFDQ
jgi:DNA ligase-1